MLSYPIAVRELCRRIDEALPATRNRGGTLRKGGRESWRKRALIEYRKVRASGKFPEDAEPIWNELKPVFAQLQGDGGSRVKCAYCERYLPIGKSGLPDGDIDHFRPKSHYYLLAYHPRNYVLACRVCNQIYKRDSFPIRGPRASNTKRPRDLDAEQAYLVHPLETRDTNLEDIIGFNGILAKSIADTGSREESRANTMIEIFALNERDDLRRERAKAISLIYQAKTTSHPEDRVVQAILSRANNRFEEHLNCVQSFLKLWQSDPDYAKQIGEEVCLLLETYF